MRKRTQGRECALQLLYQYELNPQPIEKVFAAYWEQNPETSEEAREFSEMLVTGTLQHLNEINQIVSRYARNWEINRMAVIDRSILRFATFELVFCDDIPANVTINEAVNIAKKYSQEDSGKFVNGVLDQISHSEKNRDPLASKPAPEQPS